MLKRLKDYFGGVFRIMAWACGRNCQLTPPGVIVDQMNEPRPLPLGRNEFMVWSDRIIAGALIPQDSNVPEEVYRDSIRYALANMILHLGPTESHKPDAFFIHSLRKHAINQVADSLAKEIFEKVKKRTAAQEAAAQEEVIVKDPNVETNQAQVIELKGKDNQNV